MLTKEILKEALSEFGIEKDSMLIVHSSLKALGKIDGGAETVISALEETVSYGTLVLPTISQKNFSTVFEDWSMDRPSDVGYITEVFRLQDGSLRSDDPTHSVAARGKHAAELVGGDIKAGPRIGRYGSYAFAHESTWERMYQSRERYGVKCYVILWGVSMHSLTFKHLVEYRFIEEVLNKISDPVKKKEIEDGLIHYNGSSENRTWPYCHSDYLDELLKKEGISKVIKVGEGEILCADVFDLVNAAEKAFRTPPYEIVYDHSHEWYRKALSYMD
ncbi:MAG: AAC(3) family N-acetyltransferase [Clostridia bacterium]|nr:AAC(3) family N-acetyltransferase [Clostridia bacterium]